MVASGFLGWALGSSQATSAQPRAMVRSVPADIARMNPPDSEGASPVMDDRCATERSVELPFEYQADPAWQDGITRDLGIYIERQVDYHGELAAYTTTGDYLNWGTFRAYERDEQFRFDDNGIPTIDINEDGHYYYHPTTILQYALTLHGRWQRGDAPLDTFLHVVDVFLTMQDEDGTIRFPFPYEYYLTGETLEPGWQSGLTYGQALSVYARAWLATGDTRYREGGDRTLRAMVVPAASGGIRHSLAAIDPALGGYVTFEEYPSQPTYFTLNGAMYAMLGLYDWWQIDPADDGGTPAEAHAWFECTMATLTTLLPLYEAGGLTAYDLGHVLRDVVPNTNPWYHAVHIVLLHALASVTGDPTIEAFEARWRGYVDGLPGVSG